MIAHLKAAAKTRGTGPRRPAAAPQPSGTPAGRARSSSGSVTAPGPCLSAVEQSACCLDLGTCVARLEVLDHLIQLWRSRRVRSRGRIVRNWRQGCCVLGAALPLILVVFAVLHMQPVGDVLRIYAQQEQRCAAMACKNWRKDPNGAAVGLCRDTSRSKLNSSSAHVSNILVW